MYQANFNYNNTSNSNRLATTSNTKIATIKSLSSSPLIQGKFKDVLGDKAPAFIASVVGAVNSNYALQKSDPTSVFAAAMIAATLNLSVVPTLGQAAIVPYKDKGVMKAQFQIMVRGIVQLAQRTGQYKNINAGEVYEDEYKGYDLLTGDVNIVPMFNGQRDHGERDKIVGYFAYIETVTGFKKVEYWSKAQVEAHAMRYSKSYQNGPWRDNFDAMAKKTVLKSLINHYGPMSVDTDLAQALQKDQLVVDAEGNESYADNPMGEFITPPSDNEETVINEPKEEKSVDLPKEKENQAQAQESSLDEEIDNTLSDDEFNF
mgnify:FL=1